MTKYHKKPIWEPVKMLKRPNYIISSDLGHLKTFTPSYEKDPVNMYYLMGMEYQRIWNRERDTWEEELFPVIPATKKLIIRTVKRLHIKSPKHKEISPKPASETFKMKKFQNIGSKVKTTRTGDKLADTQKGRKEDDAKSTSRCSHCSCKEPEEAAGGILAGPEGDEQCCAKIVPSDHAQPAPAPAPAVAASPIKACPQDTPCPEK